MGWEKGRYGEGTEETNQGKEVRRREGVALHPYSNILLTKI